MRVVLDTNVMVSSLLARHGNERRVMNLAMREHFVLLVSDAIVAEYEAVLRRPELKLLPDEVEAVLMGIKRLAVRVVPTESVTAARHEEDNRFLECAQAGEADYVVTGNKRHFPQSWGKTVVFNAREFLEVVGPEVRRR